MFSLLERATLKDKWQTGPKSLVPNYELQSGTALVETLSHLAKQRNALVDYKIELRVGNSRILDGSKLERRTFDENVRWMRRFFSLPYDLAGHAAAQMHGDLFFVLNDRSPITVADEHIGS